jgi:hypothetical protein
MATTASDIQAQAAVNAWLKSQTIKDMQQSIEDAYNAGVGQATASNEQILNQLNANLDAYNTQYEQDARSAYLSKMQGDRLVDSELSRLGLNDSGYGVSQRLSNQGLYSQNLYSLKNALNKNIADVNLAKVNQEAAYQGELQKLLQDKASANYDLNKYISDMSEQIRQNAISNYLQQQYNNTVKKSYEQKLDGDDDPKKPSEDISNPEYAAKLLGTEKMQGIIKNLNFAYKGAHRQYLKQGYSDGRADEIARQIQKYDIQNMYAKDYITKEEFLLLAEKFGF